MKQSHQSFVQILLLAASMFSLSAPASATSYLFDISINGLTGSGDFSTVGDASLSSSLIDTLTGTFDGSSMTLLAPRSFFGNDNLFTETSPYFDFDGLSFAAGGSDYNIYSEGGNLVGCDPNLDCGLPASYSFRTVQSGVPEPSTWAMLLLGFGAIGFSLRRVRRVRAAANLQIA